ncbi:acetyl-coenzyme A synthetase N-terminal domain-containing protein, partial [Brucella melitensis]|uniref:acetyl-coenzyme A synthetase N-terminal domain-containing protein n=1 Tax=Brucella melitensis TaxID=29459 RepID=UPI00112FAE4B
MSEKLYPVLTEAKKNTLIDNETYLEWFEESVSDPDGFWAKHGRRIDWFKTFT